MSHSPTNSSSSTERLGLPSLGSSGSLCSLATVSSPRSAPSSSSDDVSPADWYLVTGGAGFIGSHTARALMARGDNVVIVDEVNDYYDPGQKLDNVRLLTAEFGTDRCRVFYGDICDRGLIDRIFTEFDLVAVCHLAARAGVRASLDDPFVYVHSNIQGTTVLLEAARLHNVRNFCYASSSSVYGGRDVVPFRETDNVDHPVSPYAASKKTCELLASTYAHLYGLQCSGLRFFTVYGPRGRPDMAPFKFTDRIMRGVQLQQYGDGSTFRDYTFIDDIVAGIVLTLDNPAQSGYEVYNLGRGEPVSLSEFISTIERLCGRKANIEVVGAQPGDVPKTFADTSKAREMLGYKPRVSLEEGLRRTVEWYRNEYAPRKALQEASDKHTKAETLDSRFARVATCTRLHTGDDAEALLSSQTINSLQGFVTRALAYSQHVLVCVDGTHGRNNLVGQVRTILQATQPSTLDRRVHVVPVAPWGRFVAALNAALIKADELQATSILYQSVEVQASQSVVSRLIAGVSGANAETTLVCGVKFDEAQVTPWNTLAAWHLAKLRRTGWLMVSDAGEGMAGVEEAPVISLHQRLFPQDSKASFIDGEHDLNWRTQWNDDPVRQKKHERKMQSKMQRTVHQLRVLQVEEPRVETITHHIAGGTKFAA